MSIRCRPTPIQRAQGRLQGPPQTGSRRQSQRTAGPSASASGCIHPARAFSASAQPTGTRPLGSMSSIHSPFHLHIPSCFLTSSHSFTSPAPELDFALHTEPSRHSLVPLAIAFHVKLERLMRRTIYLDSSITCKELHTNRTECPNKPSAALLQSSPSTIVTSIRGASPDSRLGHLSVPPGLSPTGEADLSLLLQTRSGLRVNRHHDGRRRLL